MPSQRIEAVATGLFLRLLHATARRARLPANVTPHTFRRSCATELLRGGANMYHVKELLEQGNFGYSSHVGGGVQELHIDFGPGYRVYYGADEDSIVILLGGGSKRGQSRDIAEAIVRWERLKRRKMETQGRR